MAASVRAEEIVHADVVLSIQLAGHIGNARDVTRCDTKPLNMIDICFGRELVR